MRPRAAVEEEKSGAAKVAESLGLPIEEGIFGFKPFAELFVGRLAMLGFVSSIAVEFATGNGTLRQIGLEPSLPLFVGLSTFFGLATLTGTALTLKQAVAKQLSPSDVARYKGFLGLNKEAESAAVAADMKRRGDFTTPGDDLAGIAQARAAGLPADAVLAATSLSVVEEAERESKASSSLLTLTKAEEKAQTDAAAAEYKQRQASGPSVSLQARQDILEQQQWGTDAAELRYAKGVELDNGRFAMLGFLAAVLVEAGTGKGIILQIIGYLKLAGLLGPMSGF